MGRNKRALLKGRPILDVLIIVRVSTLEVLSRELPNPLIGKGLQDVRCNQAHEIGTNSSPIGSRLRESGRWNLESAAQPDR
jgi:hypothetical protein